MRIMRTIARVLAGFILASLVAGLVQLFYVISPHELAVLPTEAVTQRLGDRDPLTLSAEIATHSAIFAGLFALIATAVAEWLEIRSLPYYLMLGIAIALLGFAVQFSSEPGGQATILNNYALQAFTTAGFFSGLAYWLVAGRSAGGHAGDSDDMDTTGVPAAAGKAASRPRIIVDDSRAGPRKYAGSLAGRLSNRLSKAEADVELTKPEKSASKPVGGSSSTSVPTTKPPASAGDGPKKT